MSIANFWLQMSENRYTYTLQSYYSKNITVSTIQSANDQKQKISFRALEYSLCFHEIS